MHAAAASDLLERELEARYGCRGVAVGRSIIKAIAGDKTLVIAVTKFELIGHESAIFCYAWALPTDNGREKIMSTLEVTPISSAEDAVWARLNFEE